VKPLNDPIEAIFLKTFETPERDASGCGWRLGFKTKVHCKEGAFMSELIRLYPTTPQTIDQQLDDVIAAIRGFATQVLAKADFQHLMASPDEMSRLALPTFPTQSSVQPPVLAICSPLPVCTQESTVGWRRSTSLSPTMSFCRCVPFGNSTIQSVSLRVSQFGIGEYWKALGTAG
jgi:hypothetical protein